MSFAPTTIAASAGHSHYRPRYTSPSPLGEQIHRQRSSPRLRPPHPAQTHHPRPSLPPDDPRRIVFTRQLWQRTMPDAVPGESAVPNTSQSATTPSPASNSSPAYESNIAAHSSNAGALASSPNSAIQTRGRSSSINTATRSSTQRHSSPGPPPNSKTTPLTPEGSPPFRRTTRKRSAGIVDAEDKGGPVGQESSPARTRADATDPTVQVCICQPDPKIPRPRNAFILYRQHHQASVVAQNPGLANPEISKIIGEQWQKQPAKEKAEWKHLAEEEKERHRQQYPAYRYQPKRAGRSNSVTSPDAPGASSEKCKCGKCGGRTILAPTSPFVARYGSTSSSVPQTPRSANANVPTLRDLSLQSPATRRAGRMQQTSTMSPAHHDERDDLGPLSPDNKRRRFNNGDHPSAMQRGGPPPRYATAGGQGGGPATAFPFGNPPPPHQQQQAYASSTLRRESLPGLRGVVNPPGHMGPPPRPGMGYQAHRLSAGHPLTLPPLQTGHNGASPPTTNAAPPPSAGRAPAPPGSGSGSAIDQINRIDFRYKIRVLCQVAPPAAKRADAPRGPLIALEGDSPEAVAELAEWLRDMMGREELDPRVLDGPKVAKGEREDKDSVMAACHRVAAEWLGRNREVLGGLLVKKATGEEERGIEEAKPKDSRKLNEDCDVEESGAEEKADATMDDPHATEPKDPHHDTRSASSASASSSCSGNPDADKMDLDTAPAGPKGASNSTTTSAPTRPPVTLIPNYSLHASNAFARRIPIGPRDPYAPADHWQWTATQWRGILGPDLTVYVRDADEGATEGGAPPVGIETVQGREDVGVFVVKRAEGNGNGGSGVEASVLRRLCFEVCEWVRGFEGLKVE